MIVDELPAAAAAPPSASAPDPLSAPGTLAALLAGLRPLFPAALAPADAWDRLLAGCGALPALVAGYMGFEFRLGEADAGADLCAALHPDGPLAAHLAGKGRTAAPGSPDAALGAFVSAFTAQEAPWARQARLVLLEYDVARGPLRPAGTTLPGIFLTLRPRPRGAAADLARVLAAGFPAAAGLRPLAAERRVVERILAVLPPAARMLNAGVFPVRRPRALRLVVTGLDASGALGLLKALAWPGPLAEVAALLSGVGGVCTRCGLALDVTAAGLGPRVGVELSVGAAGADWTTTTRRDWEPLVDSLGALGLLSASRADGLLAWPGRQRVFTASGGRIACQGVNHVKVSFGAAAPAAKAYAGLALLRRGARVPPSERV